MIGRQYIDHVVNSGLNYLKLTSTHTYSCKIHTLSCFGVFVKLLILTIKTTYNYNMVHGSRVVIHSIFFFVYTVNTILVPRKFCWQYYNNSKGEWRH